MICNTRWLLFSHYHYLANRLRLKSLPHKQSSTVQRNASSLMKDEQSICLFVQESFIVSTSFKPSAYRWGSYRGSTLDWLTTFQEFLPFPSGTVICIPPHQKVALLLQPNLSKPCTSRFPSGHCWHFEWELAWFLTPTRITCSWGILRTFRPWFPLSLAVFQGCWPKSCSSCLRSSWSICSPSHFLPRFRLRGCPLSENEFGRDVLFQGWRADSQVLGLSLPKMWYFSSKALEFFRSKA